MRVRLTKKYAEQIDGVDLAGCQPGDVLDLADPQARLLLAEEWAIPERRESSRQTPHHRRAQDSDRTGNEVDGPVVSYGSM